MEETTANNDGSQELVLEESIDITTINNFYSELNGVLHNSSRIVIDAAAVKRIDTSAFQLLCSWYQDAVAKGIEVRWKNIDGVFFNSANLLGLSKHLALE